MTEALILIISTLLASVNAKPVKEIPYFKTATRPGWEERGPEFKKWLSPSVRINGGSGTLCYYDYKKNEMYAISCGHLFRSGRRSAAWYRKNPTYMTVEVFYHNDKKLSEPKKYKARVLGHVWGDSNSSIFDVSLMKFTPDWEEPWILPIAPLDYKLKKNKYYHSVGCDGRSEVAHYSVKYLEESASGNVSQIITIENSPRRGRSGGGVFTDDGQLVFICSRSNSYAYWTSLKQIHKFLKEEGYAFVLEGGPLARQVPIVDIANPNRQFSRNYIPLPR
jgi:hypothetical protein